jgi:hypothetical protein
MAKLNVYLADEELLKRVKVLGLPISQICRDALWEAVEKAESKVCKKCKQPAVYHVIKPNSDTYACKDHVTLYLGDNSTVRTL